MQVRRAETGLAGDPLRHAARAEAPPAPSLVRIVSVAPPDSREVWTAVTEALRTYKTAQMTASATKRPKYGRDSAAMRASSDMAQYRQVCPGRCSPGAVAPAPRWLWPTAQDNAEPPSFVIQRQRLLSAPDCANAHTTASRPILRNEPDCSLAFGRFAGLSWVMQARPNSCGL